MNSYLVYVFIGILAFICMSLFDVASLQGLSWPKYLLLLVATFAAVVGVVGVLSSGPRLPLPPFLMPLGWLFIVLFGFLLIYSLLIEIPLTTTYLRPGAPRALINTGTYALTRHPGVLWMAFLLLGILLVSGSQRFIVAALVWWLMDVAYVWFQDRIIFPRQFAQYSAYQQTTPMLMPTRASARRCLQTLPWRRKTTANQR